MRPKFSVCQLPVTTSGKKKGRKLVRAISAESIYHCMLLLLDHILYRRAHVVRDTLRALRAVLAIIIVSYKKLCDCNKTHYFEPTLSTAPQHKKNKLLRNDIVSKPELIHLHATKQYDFKMLTNFIIKLFWNGFLP